MLQCFKYYNSGRFKMENTRRRFLKKVAYTAPAVVGLGMLSAPVNAEANICSVTRAEFRREYKQGFKSDYLSGHSREEWRDEGKTLWKTEGKDDFKTAWKTLKRAGNN